MNILFLGKEWLGSNSLGLAEGFRKLHHSVNIVNDDYYYSPKLTSLPTRAIHRLSKPLLIKEYNDEVLRQDQLMNPDLVVVAKGALLTPDTLSKLKDKGRLCVLFYPDTSLLNFGPRIPKCVPLYDRIFTTKPNLPAYIKTHFLSDNGIFMPHAADGDLHKILNYNDKMAAIFSCDLSFIGNWSLKKEKFLSDLIKLRKGLNLKIWGPRWNTHAKSANLVPFIQGIGVHGDLYVNAIKYSKINLAILFEGNSKAPEGDLITSRTFHIPGSGGFMLHERTTHLLDFYKEDKEIACFDSVIECSNKIDYYLENEEERELVRLAGHKRTQQENLMQHRAQFILQNLSLE